MDLETFRQARGPITTFRLPHNYRDEIYPEGEGPSFCHYADGNERRPAPHGSNWADLPIRMPRSVICFTDEDGRVIAIVADGQHIKWKDIDIVMRAVEQYNEDCARLGITGPSPSPMLGDAESEVWRDGEPPDPDAA